MGKRHSSTTLEAARAVWLADARFRRLSPVTIREYGRISGSLLSHLADKVALLGAAPLHVTYAITLLAETGRRVPGGGGGGGGG